MKPVMNLLLPCLLVAEIAALHSDGEGLQLHKVMQPGYADQKGVAPTGVTAPNPSDKQEPHVVKVEKHVRKHTKKVMDAIDKFRAEICANMKDEFGKKFETFDQCSKFMNKTCKPGEDKAMDGDNHEVSSEKGYCKEYFPEAVKKAEKEEEEEELDHAGADWAIAGPAPGPSPGPGPGPSPAPAPATVEEAPAPAPKAGASTAGSPGPAPAPGPSGSPGPAPVPAPFTPGKSSGKPWGAITEDEAYYYKGDGKDAMRLHMDEAMKLPTQGYWGKLVEHQDGETVTDDWQKEFGPKSGHRSIAEICKHRPYSSWCKRNGYGRTFRSVACPVYTGGVALLLALAAIFAF